MTRLTDEQVAELRTRSEIGHSIVLGSYELCALLDERAALRANADAVAKERLAYKDAHGPWADLTTQEALNAEFTRLTAQRDALTRRCERLREAFHRAAVALHVHGNHRALWLDCTTPLCVHARALAADEKEE